MNLSDVYTLNHSMQTITSGEVTRVVSSEFENTDLMVLKGPSAHVLKYFDGRATLAEVRAKFEKEYGIHGTENDFMKMINFLIENQIILSRRERSPDLIL
jgi:hypothetical protein